MKIKKEFWISLAVMIILFIIPTILTYNDIAFDGTRDYGFPLTFYSVGGFCMAGEACYSFSIFYLIIDLIVLIGVPLLINYLLNKKG